MSRPIPKPGLTYQDSAKQPDVPEAFPLTSLSELFRAKGNDTVAHQAIESLCHKYWYPLYAFVRRRGHSFEDAQDITQGFFASFLGGSAFEGYDPARGKLRSYLLGALKHYEMNWKRDQQTLKAGRDYQFVSFEWSQAENRYQSEPHDSETPDFLFDRRWAITVLEEADIALKSEYARKGKQALFEVVHPYIHGHLDCSLEEAADRLGMTPAAFKMAGSRMRGRTREVLRTQISETVASGDLVDEEIRYLFSLFAGQISKHDADRGNQ